MFRIGIVFTICFAQGILGGTRNAQYYIDLVNNANTTWKAGHNFHNVPSEYIRKLTGTLLTDFHILPHWTSTESVGDDDIPKSFDAHAKWPYCPHIKHVRDQGACGSCWAVSATSVLTDRLCIASKGNFTKPISSEELMTCCETCGPSDDGCEGGSHPLAWVYVKENGLVTGGDYRSHIGCQPYQLQPCGHTSDSKRVNCAFLIANTTAPACSKKCLNPFYKTPFAKDHQTVKSAFIITNDEKAIQREIMTRGPVASAFMVYADFSNYKSGVYQRVSHEEEGGHGVKVIGWGTEGGVDYWLAVNSWNTDWGDLNGLFKIRRMQNGVNFEEAITFPVV